MNSSPAAGEAASDETTIIKSRTSNGVSSVTVAAGYANRPPRVGRIRGR